MIARLRTFFTRQSSEQFGRTVYDALDSARAGRDLSMIGHAKRKAAVRETARQIRAEIGLSEDPRLA